MAASNFYAPQLQHPITPPSQNVTPAQDQFQAGTPVQDQFQAQIPVQDQFQAQIPVQDQFQAQIPAQDQFQAQIPVQDQFQAQIPAQDQFQAQIPAQDQFRAQTPIQDLNLFPVQHHAPPPASASASSSLASSSKSLPDQLPYKNRLQEYYQQSGFQLPVYQTINEAVPFQQPSFRSSVLVDGACYTSPNTFPSRKAAEQDVARLAMMRITERIKELDVPLIHEAILQDLGFCKAILNEYAVKRNMEKPIYNTVQTKGFLPAFVSSLFFNGVSFTGEIGKSKKLAEQLAARAVIQSLLGDSESGTIMSEVIKSKHKLKMKDLHLVHASPASQAVNTGHSSAVLTNAPIATVPEASSGMLLPHHEFIKRKPEEPAAQGTLQLPITFVPSVSEQPFGVASTPFGVTPTSLGTTGTSLGVSPLSLGINATYLGIGPTSVGTGLTSVGTAPTSVGITPPSVGIAPPSLGITSLSLGIPPLSLGVGSPCFGIAPASKKRRKNKKKANKNLHNDSQLPVAGTLPSNQSAPCSVSQ